MSAYTSTEIVARLRATLPARWFADDSPVLDALLAGLAQAWLSLFGFLDFVRVQARIRTASGEWLDLISSDFFGTRLPRRNGESDGAFCARILLELRRPRATRAAITGALQDLTGRAPVIFEPARAADTGAWNMALGYGVAGGWGSLMLPYECFVLAYRPSTGSTDPEAGAVADADICAAIANVLPAAAVAWTRIEN